jgi:restriction system protein
MKLRMAENSLFAILLRKPWWVSALTALALLAFARFGVPPAWFFYAAPIALPFVVIACITGWRALQAPSASRVAATDQTVRAMGAAEFGAALEQAWTREGWQVARIDDAGADFALTQGWRRSIASYRRWKVARTGIEPLRELAAARERREAHDAIYVAIGEVSDQAVAFARANKIRIVRADDLAKLLPPPAGGLLKRFSG